MQLHWCPGKPLHLKCSGEKNVLCHVSADTRYTFNKAKSEKNHEQSTLKSGNSVKLQMCKYCRPKCFVSFTRIPMIVTGESALGMKKAPSVVNSCNSRKTSQLALEKPFSLRGCLPKTPQSNTNGTVVLIL